jgi:hypothetical protein
LAGGGKLPLGGIVVGTRMLERLSTFNERKPSVIGLIFVFANGFWIFGLAFIFEAGRRIVFEAEFLLPAEFTVISYRNGCDCLYMQRERGGEEKRLSFESALKNAIEKSK